MIKRIIAISNHSFFLGGGEKSFLDLISNLPEPWDVLTVVPGKGELEDKLIQNRIKTEIADLPSLRPWTIYKIFSGLKQYFNVLQRNSPSLIYANGSRAAFYTGITCRIQKIPVIWHCRIADRDRYLDPLLCRLSNKIIANSNATAKRFKPCFQYKVSIIHNGVDIEWMQNMDIEKPDLIQADWKVILIVARISKWKRHDLALSAFEKIAPSNPRVHLVCVGAEDQLEPEWYDYLMKITRRSRFSDRIHWIGHVDDVRPWYRYADILLLPSKNEPFGRVIVEAMACGVPVVATNGGGVPEIIRDGKDGLLVPLGDSDKIAYAMLKILENDLLRENLCQSARKRAEDFSLEKHVEEMVKIFESFA